MQAKPMRNEKREFGRRTTCLGGWIEVRGRPAIPCRVLDVSEGGARLRFPAATALPKRFNLRIDTGSMVHVCELRRGDGTEFGVEFVTAASEIVDPAAVRALEDFARNIPWGQE